VICALQPSRWLAILAVSKNFGAACFQVDGSTSAFLFGARALRQLVGASPVPSCRPCRQMRPLNLGTDSVSDNTFGNTHADYGHLGGHRGPAFEKQFFSEHLGR